MPVALYDIFLKIDCDIIFLILLVLMINPQLHMNALFMHVIMMIQMLECINKRWLLKHYMF